MVGLERLTQLRWLVARCQLGEAPHCDEHVRDDLALQDARVMQAVVHVADDLDELPHARAGRDLQEQLAGLAGELLGVALLNGDLLGRRRRRRWLGRLLQPATNGRIQEEMVAIIRARKRTD